MTNETKNMKFTALINGTLYDVMPRTTSEQVYLDDETPMTKENVIAIIDEYMEEALGGDY